MPDRAAVKERIDEIEAEMKRCGCWQEKPLPPEAYRFHQAFAIDTMPFTSWLQFIFIPRVRQIIESGGQFPTTSQVGVQAVREFDSVDEASDLVGMLIEFDQLIEEG
jgi:uncharacterized protein YqcC (DUF446 family)